MGRISQAIETFLRQYHAGVTASAIEPYGRGWVHISDEIQLLVVNHWPTLVPANAIVKLIPDNEGWAIEYVIAPDAGKLADIKWPIKEPQAKEPTTGDNPKIPDELLERGALLDGTPWQLESNAYGDYWLRHTEKNVRNELRQVVGRLPRSKPGKRPE